MTQDEFAEISGVTKATVSRAQKPGGELYACSHARKIDVNDPAAISFIERRALKHVNGKYKAAQRRTHPVREIKVEAPEPDRRAQLDALAADIRGLAHLPLAELVEIFGDDIRFSEWLKSIREMEIINEKRLKNAVARGELVKRDKIHSGIFLVLDTLFRQILSDGARNIAVKSVTMTKAGRETDEITEYVRQVLGKYIETAKKKMAAAMRGVGR